MVFLPKCQLFLVLSHLFAITFSQQAGKRRDSATAIVNLSKTPDEDSRPTFGIEELFKDFEKPVVSLNKLEDGVGVIAPSAVLKRQPQDHLDLEPSLQPADASIDKSMLYSNFVNGETSLLGLITSTGGTLVANGITTIRAVKVIGTQLPNGKYAQVVETTSEVFEPDNDEPGFAGTVQHVDEKPTLGLEFVDPAANNRGNDKLTLADLFRKGDDKVRASKDFRDRLKNRYQKFKAESVDSVSVSGNGKGLASPITSATISRRSRQRSFGGGNVQKASVEVTDSSAEETSRSPSSAERALRLDSRRPSSASSSRFRTRNRQTSSSREVETNKQDSKVVIALPEDYSSQASVQQKTISKEEDSGPRFNRFRSSTNRKRFSATRKFNDLTAANAATAAPADATTTTSPQQSLKLARPDNSVESAGNNERKKNGRPDGVTFKSFNRFNRPDIRKSLLDKILHKGKGGDHHIDPDHEEEQKEATAGDDEEEVKHVDPESQLLTTLSVSTIFPDKDRTNTAVEVATIKSPYSFAYEDSSSTRFITVTRTFTKSSTDLASASVSAQLLESPLFKTETIPAPINILTTADSGSLESTTTELPELSSSIEILPAVILATTSSIDATPALQTITETFSTSELTLKTSLLPIVVNGKTSIHTLTQSFYVTKVIEAVKTLPPIENFEFVATKAFKDFNNVLDEAGSEKREQLLPGELEFSDQDVFDLNGPSVVRVPPPEGFEDDLKLHINKVEDNQALRVASQPPVAIQSSFTPNNLPQQEASAVPTTITNQFQQTPALPENMLNPLAGLNADQIRQLAFLQYLQSFGGFGGLGALAQLPQAITTSKPIYRTETVYATSTIPLFLGAKKFYTTLTQSLGVTTHTEYEMQTVAANANLGGIHGLGNPEAALLGANPGTGPIAAAGPDGAFMVTSHMVTQDTMIPSTIEREIRITFRNSPTVTTLTSTTLISTQITSYVTQTVRNLATINPLAGLGFNPLAAFLG